MHKKMKFNNPQTLIKSICYESVCIPSACTKKRARAGIFEEKTFRRLPSFGDELIETTNLVQNSYQLLSTPILKKESNNYISPSFVQIKIDEIELYTYIL